MPLILDLVRHGEAQPAGPEGDAARPLTPAGRRVIRRQAERLRAERWRPDRVFSSDLRRARETAEILCRVAGLPAAALLAELEPHTAPEAVLDALAREGVVSGQVLLVGHQPMLGRLATWLTGLESGFAPGGLLRIQCRNGLERGAGTTLLALRPEDDA